MKRQKREKKEEKGAEKSKSDPSSDEIGSERTDDQRRREVKNDEEDVTSKVPVDTEEGIAGDGPPSADIRAYYHPTTLKVQNPVEPLSMTPPMWCASSTSSMALDRGRLTSQRSVGAMSSRSVTPQHPRSKDGPNSSSRSPRIPSPHASSSGTGRIQMGQEQWQKQCAVSSERESSYVGAQRIRDRIRQGEIPGDRIFSVSTDECVEIAMRGRDHVLLGRPKGARHAHRTWRSIVHNAPAQPDTPTVSNLFAEFEEALVERQGKNPLAGHR